MGGGYDHKDDGVYAYEGKTDPYGSRGTASKSCTWSGLFDDYGRAITSPSSKKDKDKSTSLKVVRAVPKAESNTDGKSGVQKFRVKLLPETGGQSVMDVLCMVCFFSFFTSCSIALYHVIVVDVFSAFGVNKTLVKLDFRSRA